jgi:hypothetical protein
VLRQQKTLSSYFCSPTSPQIRYSPQDKKNKTSRAWDKNDREIRDKKRSRKSKTNSPFFSSYGWIFLLMFPSEIQPGLSPADYCRVSLLGSSPFFQLNFSCIRQNYRWRYLQLFLVVWWHRASLFLSLFTFIHVNIHTSRNGWGPLQIMYIFTAVPR